MTEPSVKAQRFILHTKDLEAEMLRGNLHLLLCSPRSNNMQEQLPHCQSEGEQHKALALPGVQCSWHLCMYLSLPEPWHSSAFHFPRRVALAVGKPSLCLGGNSSTCCSGFSHSLKYI